MSASFGPRPEPPRRARKSLHLVAALGTFVFGTHSARAEATPSPSTGPHLEPSSPPVGMFVDTEWRVMGVGGHISHGPAFAAGATFFGGAFRVGLGGLARPGPFNPATFDVTLPEGTTYRDESTLALRSDGGFFGLHLGLSYPLPFEPTLALQLPVTIGYGGFGFYLHGEDRETPDGRRVSEWENDLFGERDSFLGVVIDAALRVRFRPRALPWLAPYAGAAFTIVPGFETVVRSDYLGVSGLVGVEMGLGI